MKKILTLIGALFAFPQPALATPIFHWITESDPGGPNNVIVTSFNSLTDLINLNVASSSPIFNLPGGISISGLTFDGSQYHWITESDPGGPNNVIVTSFNSLTDLINLNVASSSPIFNLPGGISISGLTSVSDPLQVPEPATATLFITGLAGLTGLLLLRRRKGKT